VPKKKLHNKKPIALRSALDFTSPAKQPLVIAVFHEDGVETAGVGSYCSIHPKHWCTSNLELLLQNVCLGKRPFFFGKHGSNP
jgi:hypothetical protein